MENLMMYDVAPFLETPVIREAARPIGNMGSILLECGRLSAENVEQILRLQKGQRVRFGEAGRRLGLLHDSDIRHALALQFRCASLQMGQGGSAQHLAAACRPFSNESRGLRSIRSQLTQQGYAHGRKTLAIVGVDDTDSSLFAANLALVYAQIDKRTLLIDANLRAERQAAIFGAGPVLGLSDVLAGRAADEAIMPAAADCRHARTQSRRSPRAWRVSGVSRFLAIKFRPDTDRWLQIFRAGRIVGHRRPAGWRHTRGAQRPNPLRGTGRYCKAPSAGRRRVGRNRPARRLMPVLHCVPARIFAPITVGLSGMIAAEFLSAQRRRNHGTLLCKSEKGIPVMTPRTTITLSWKRR
jgi:hypothetical protein